MTKTGGVRRAEVPRTDYDNPEWRAHLDDLEQHRPFRSFETTVIDASGVSRPVMISGTLRFAADGTFEGYIGVGNDLTALRRHEREASTTAANLESILENIEQGVVLSTVASPSMSRSTAGRCRWPTNEASPGPNGRWASSDRSADG